MEPISTLVAAEISAEATTEAAAVTAEGMSTEIATEEALKETLAETDKAVSQITEGVKQEYSKKVLNTLKDKISTGERYKILRDYQKAVEADDLDTQKVILGNPKFKGDLGQAYMEAAMSQFGEALPEVTVKLEGAASNNRVDLFLPQSSSNMKLLELKASSENVFVDSNYDVAVGDSMAVEVKNGTLESISRQLANGELQQQVKAAQQLSKNCYVVINEGTAQQIVKDPIKGAEFINKINEAGGKVIVNLPNFPTQVATILF